MRAASVVDSDSNPDQVVHGSDSLKDIGLAVGHEPKAEPGGTARASTEPDEVPAIAVYDHASLTTRNEGMQCSGAVFGPLRSPGKDQRCKPLGAYTSAHIIIYNVEEEPDTQRTRRGRLLSISPSRNHNGRRRLTPAA